jgi:hypothetical protein
MLIAGGDAGDPLQIARTADAIDVRDDSGQAQRMCQTTTPTAYLASVLRLGNWPIDRRVRRHIIAVATLASGTQPFDAGRDNNRGKAPAAQSQWEEQQWSARYRETSV